MDNDERDRPELPEPPEPGDAPDPNGEPEPEVPAPDQAPEPEDAPERVDAPAPSEIESWPSTAGAAPTSEPEPAAPVVDAAAVEAWPTEPPVAGSGGPDTWPTTPPEMGDEPILEPVTDDGPPPSEVEAYPAAAAATVAAASVEGPPVDVPPTSPPSEPAPASEPAAPGPVESTQCPRCGTENQPGLSFCRNCGQRLVAAGVASTVARPAAPEGTMACPRCGTHNRAGVAFCQNCGANLRGTAPGYVPPAAASAAAAAEAQPGTGGAVLGPVVLLIGVIGLVTAYLLPFAYGTTSLFERAFGSGGYGLSFWSSMPEGGLADTVYFALAAAIPVLCVLLVVLAIAGFVRARPGPLGVIGLAVALGWSVALAVGFLLVEVAGNWSGDIVGLLRLLSPAGIIAFLSSLIVVIGTLTRFGRS
jgi:hypothetical protein